MLSAQYEDEVRVSHIPFFFKIKTTEPIAPSLLSQMKHLFDSSKLNPRYLPKIFFVVAYSFYLLNVLHNPLMEHLILFHLI